MHKQFKWAIVVQKEGVECRLGTKKIEKKILMFANQNVELCWNSVWNLAYLPWAGTLTLLVGMQTGTATMENSVEIS